VAREVLASGVFTDGALEGEPINDFSNFFYGVCHAIYSPPGKSVCQQLEKELSAISRPIRVIGPICLSAIVKGKTTFRVARCFERLVRNFVEFQEQALQTARQAAVGYNPDPIDRLIEVFLRYEVSKSKRAIAKAIARLSEISSLRGHIITDEAVRKRVRERLTRQRRLEEFMAGLRQ
jgi:hypothetical protein